MTSEQDDAVFEHSLEEEDDEDVLSSQSDDDPENDVLPVNDFDDDEEDLNSVSPSSSSPATVTTITSSVPLAVPTVTVALPAAVTTPVILPDLKRPRVSLETTVDIKPSIPQPQQQQQQQQLDDSSRRLFQRLWTDEDEIELLQGFLDYTAQRGSARGPNNHHDTALFYDQIKSKLQLDFNKNQLVEKLRRLKKKYRNVLAKIGSGKDFSFKSPHDQATFEISCKIWNTNGTGGGGTNLVDEDDGNLNANPNLNFNDAVGDVKFEDNNQKFTPKPSRKRSRSRTHAIPAVGGVSLGVAGDVASGGGLVENVVNSNGNVSAPNVVEETVRSCLGPVFKELLSNAVGGGSRGVGVGPLGMGGLMVNALPLSFFGGGMGGEMMMGDEKFRKQYMLELEVYSKRLDLVQNQIRAQLEELKTMGDGSNR